MIEVGDYVKDKFGRIGKIKSYSNGTYFTENFGASSGEIVNHSKNIIDLIKEGDVCILEDEFCEINCFYMYDKSFIQAIKEDLKEGRKLILILTHEQMEANCYRLEE